MECLELCYVVKSRGIFACFDIFILEDFGSILSILALRHRKEDVPWR